MCLYQYLTLSLFNALLISLKRVDDLDKVWLEAAMNCNPGPACCCNVSPHRPPCKRNWIDSVATYSFIAKFSGLPATVQSTFFIFCLFLEWDASNRLVMATRISRRIGKDWTKMWMREWVLGRSKDNPGKPRDASIAVLIHCKPNSRTYLHRSFGSTNWQQQQQANQRQDTKSKAKTGTWGWVSHLFNRFSGVMRTKDKGSYGSETQKQLQQSIVDKASKYRMSKHAQFTYHCHGLRQFTFQFGGKGRESSPLARDFHWSHSDLKCSPLIAIQGFDHKCDHAEHKTKINSMRHTRKGLPERIYQSVKWEGGSGQTIFLLDLPNSMCTSYGSNLILYLSLDCHSLAQRSCHLIILDIFVSIGSLLLGGHTSPTV